MLSLGILAKEVGTHSFRKGVANELSNSPGLQSRYIFSGSGGDQFVGRAAAGLNVNDIEFAHLPPHFNGLTLSQDDLDTILPGYSSYYPESFRCVVPFLLASIVYHSEWLMDNLSADHPLFSSLLWTTKLVSRLDGQIETGRIYNPVSSMRATGVPPHVVLAERMKAIEDKLCFMEQIFSSLPNQIRDAIAEQITLPPQSTMSQQFLDDLCSNIVSRLQQSPLTLPETDVSEPNAPNLIAPSDLKCPTCKVFDAWHMWWNGVPKFRVSTPLRRFLPRDFPKSSDRVNFSKLKRVMTELLKHASVDERELVRLDVLRRTQEFERCMAALCNSLGVDLEQHSIGRRKMSDLTYPTLYDLIAKGAKKL
ncbi:hypothetical protein AeNC1_014444 [Aphanomyces euteiches]|nr:hypothetical protein AeNC1_014444 [Aphanomyces euteiches]